jgi:hypothetical protein
MTYGPFRDPGSPKTWIVLPACGGTPDDALDDCGVSRVGGHPAPMPVPAWQTYRFGFPSESTTLPQGRAVQGCPGLTEDEAWNRVITRVDQLRFFTGDPDLFFIFQVWDIGLDNPSITYDAYLPFEP